MTDWGEAAEVVFDCPPAFLNLPHTLECGQAFRWRGRPDGSWVGVVRGRAVRLRREGDVVLGQVYPAIPEAAAVLASYLRLDVDLASLSTGFAAADPWMASAVSSFPGLRVLNQEPQETLLSYLCSAANSVPRIMDTVEQMSRRYGWFIGSLEGEDYFAFPSASSLAAASERELTEGCGLGWRAATIKGVAAELAHRAQGWPEQLRRLPYREARAALMGLKGVGAKIADCVCLFALGKDEAVPVDTHVWAMAREIFGLQIPTKTLTAATYDVVARLFVERYGRYAGWAQEYLYHQRRCAQGRVRARV